MQAPALPADESARLAALHGLGVLDTPPEERFDRLTRLAKRLFGVPIVLVSLIDANRQWFKSCIGLPVTETSREISFCGHAILSHDVMLVPDARLDDRFSDNPLVTGEPYIRFYAGCPLRVAGGHRLGTLCLIDREPRVMSEDDLALLRDLARMAEQELSAVQIATLDELTALSNRRGFMALARQALAACRRTQKVATLLYFDLNGFKPINDRYGHAEGDLALKAFADCMREAFRDSDLLARLGGDEFVVLLSDSTAAQAQGAVERFRDTLALHDTAAGRGYALRCSVGVVERAPDSADSLEDLLAAGDQAMYRAKRAAAAQAGAQAEPPAGRA